MCHHDQVRCVISLVSLLDRGVQGCQNSRTMECDKPAASLKHCEGADQETQIMAQAVATIVTLKGGLVNSDFKLLNQVLWLHRLVGSFRASQVIKSFSTSFSGSRSAGMLAAYSRSV